MNAGGRTAEGDGDPGNGRHSPLLDGPLLDLMDTLVNDRGRVAAAEALGVNYRTMMACYDSRHVSRRMRKALADFRDSEEAWRNTAKVGDGGCMAEADSEPLEQRVVALEEEQRPLRGIVEAQAEQLTELSRRVERLEEGNQQPGEAATASGDDGRRQELRPPRQGHGLPDDGVITLEQQPDEEHAFGPAAPLVTEWRELRTGGESVGSRVDQARAAVRRWGLEIVMLHDFRLTLPPETEPLDEARRTDHLRWRMEALEEARRELSRAERVRLLRRLLTVGLWWK